MKRQEALKIISQNLRDNDVVVSTTGFISRELFAALDRPGNFYMIGSMGLATPFALGMALSKPNRRFISIEGDGSALLNLGGLSMVNAFGASNLSVIVLDNGVYGSTGEQPTISNKVNFEKIARSLNFKNVKKISSAESLKEYVSGNLKKIGPSFVSIKVSKDFDENISRINISPQDLKKRLEEALLYE